LRGWWGRGSLQMRGERYLRLLERLRDSSLFRRAADSLKGRRLIFTVTTGRSGTAFLAKAFSLLPGITSLHEPEPDFVRVLRKVQTSPEVALKFLVYRKFPAIADFQTPVYAETSHLFCKGFLEPTLDLGILPELVLLKRDRRKVAKSLFELNTIPGRTPLALLYYLKPDDPSVFLPVEDFSSLTDYQLCYWYCLEIERRMEEYEKRVKSLGGRVYRLRFEDMVAVDGFVELLKATELYPAEALERAKPYLKEALSRPVNQKKEGKVRSLFKEHSEEELRQMEREVEELVGYGGVSWE